MHVHYFTLQLNEPSAQSLKTSPSTLSLHLLEKKLVVHLAKLPPLIVNFHPCQDLADDPLSCGSTTEQALVLVRSWIWVVLRCSVCSSTTTLATFNCTLRQFLMMDREFAAWQDIPKTPHSRWKASGQPSPFQVSCYSSCKRKKIIIHNLKISTCMHAEKVTKFSVWNAEIIKFLYST